METLTSLGSGGKESNLDLLLPQFISQFRDCVPCPYDFMRTPAPSRGESLPCSDSLPELIQIIKEMNFSCRVDSDLVSRTNAETGVIAWTKVHQAFTSSRVGLFVEGARDWEPVYRNIQRVRTLDVGELRGLNVDGGGLRSRRDVGTRR